MHDQYLITGRSKPSRVSADDAMLKHSANARTDAPIVPDAGNVNFTMEGIREEETLDELGIEPKDIELVMSQAACSRDKSIKELKENDGNYFTLSCL